MTLLRWSRIPVAMLMLGGAAGWASSQTTGGVVAGQGPVRKAKVVVMAVADGKERGGDAAGGSGILVRSALRDAVVARGFAPFTSDNSSMTDAIKEAKDQGYEYVLRASITEWEDNATAWSSKRDSIALSLELYDLTPTLVASSNHRQKGSMVALTDSGPDRLLAKAVAAVVGRVFGGAR